MTSRGDDAVDLAFPFLFGRAFIEAGMVTTVIGALVISLPFRKGFH